MAIDFDCFSDGECKMRVVYVATNECVEAVVRGLDVRGDDSILTICGSGDVPFALVENGARVVAVDVNPIQIEYGQWRLKRLMDGAVDAFFRFTDEGRGERNTLNRDYFSVEGRLSRVKEYSQRIEFVEGNIFRGVGEDVCFTKIFLSNVLGFGDNSRDLASVASHLTPNGFVYITQDRFFGQSRFFDLPQRFVDDAEQTAVARAYEKFWLNPGPTVLRKEK